MQIVKRIVGTLILPVGIYIVMLALCYANGKTYFGSLVMWKQLLVNIGAATTCALGIGLQFKCGRFDFSGGAIMLIAAIVAGNTAKANGSSMILYALLSMVICIGLSVGVALLYTFGRLPIIIATIGIALLYEAITALIFNGAGVNLTSDMTLRKFAQFPLGVLPLIGAIVVFVIYYHFTSTGKQAELLANNQQAAVNIGISEKKNVIISYIYSGAIFGFATMIYGANGIIDASFTSLATVGQLFSNILPVFIALMLMRFCGYTIGIIAGSFALCILNYGLTISFQAEMGAAVTTVITGIFILVINIVNGQSENIGKLFSKKNKAEV